ncbi:MAG: DNA polymerase III subunit gamma/tau, partial [Acidobacteria bacterium]|nr:DNA polymerase III subunit gamma/tau [Acidobacteriota bacterium]
AGPRGSGKTTTARILAKALNCHKGRPGEPCGECPACLEIAAGNCMDVLEIDAASHGLVDQTRDLIDQVRYNPARDRNKIFIIDEAHMLSTASFNALLKTLEEPPPRVVFILATTEYHKIPATILSRCQQYNFRLIHYPLILNRLKEIAKAEKIQISDAALEQVVYASGGSMRDAMSALDQVIAFSGDTVRDEDVAMLLGLVEPRVLGETVRAISAGDVDAILKIVGSQVEIGQDLQNFCRRLLNHVRNLMVVKAGVSDTGLLGVPESTIPDLRSQADLFSREDLLRQFDACLRIESDLRHATQPRFQLEMGLIEMAQLARLRPLEELIAEFADLARGEPVPRPVPPQARAGPPGLQPRRQAVTAAQPPPAAVGPSVSSETAHTPAPPPAPHVEPPASPAAPAGAVALPEGVRDPTELILRISAHVKKESLESILQELPGAELQADALLLDVGPVNEFFRRQIRENLPLIAGAAAEVLGRNVAVKLVSRNEGVVAAARDNAGQEPQNLKPDVLERARREPVIQSFLELFPGPVKAEEIEQ